jgi:hypothetical protein
MSEPECQIIHELDALRPQNDTTAIANVGLFESDLPAQMAKRRVWEAAMSRIDAVVFHLAHVTWEEWVLTVGAGWGLVRFARILSWKRSTEIMSPGGAHGE